MTFKTVGAEISVCIPVIFSHPVAAVGALVCIPLRTTPAPPFVGIGEVDKVFGIAVFVAMLAVGEVFFPARFAVDIPVTVYGIIVFRVDEKLIALAALLEMTFPAFVAKEKSLIVDSDRNQILRFPAEVADVVHLNISILVVGCVSTHIGARSDFPHAF